MAWQTGRVTGQFADEVMHDDAWHAITAVDGTGLFDAAEHGFSPRMMSTACHRGSLCKYRIDARRLVLHAAEIGAAPGTPPVPLLGVEPGRSAYPEAFRGQLSYVDLNAPVGFTGRLLIGAEPVSIGYLHMGFRPAYGFARVWELAFDGGALTAAADRSADLAEVRSRLVGTRPEPAPGESAEDWIDRTFSLSFAYSWPES
ncbi:hypothetical protein OHA72_54265 [Dactylosporangium sp. NBC_01737]|uniref:hypothetical protein n=1 Tax=Dactylosporangium sp. NBC_01737 TaxID=2975959 RepID=UPI002E14763D|nr:hypothetical protein OHA72_54265 [Dactylosporangium sp. NBC_01737]